MTFKVFFDDHRNDVGTTGGGTDVKQQRRTPRRQENAQQQLHKRLVGQRLRQRKENFKYLEHCRKSNGDIKGFKSELLAQQQQTDHHQGDIDD